jgi:hypothetical protein
LRKVQPSRQAAQNRNRPAKPRRITLSFWPLIAAASHQLDMRGRCVLDLFTFLAENEWSAAKVPHLYAWPIGGGRAAARPPAPKGALCIRHKKPTAKTALPDPDGANVAKNRSMMRFRVFVFS